jgi:hypothetical protein
MNSKFHLADRVCKRDGDEYPGVVVSVFTSTAGVVCYVVEMDPRFSGKFKIFVEGELELLPP